MRTLTREEAQSAGTRAFQVVNGFAQVRDQQARDALNLAHTCEQLYSALEKARTAAAEASKPNGGAANSPFGRVFDDIWADLHRTMGRTP